MKLVSDLRSEVKGGKLTAKHKTLYTAIAEEVERGMVSSFYKGGKEPALRRDWMELELEKQVRIYGFEKKFKFAVQSCQLEGERAFPFEPCLLEDEPNEKCALAPLFKLQHPNLRFKDMTERFELVIRQKHTFFQMVIKNIAAFDEINHFFNVVSFVNELGKSVNNKMTRNESREITLQKHLSRLEDDMGDGFPRGLKNGASFIESWTTLAKTLGVLQVNCKTYGTMNDEHSLKSPLHTFLIDPNNQ